MASSSPYSALGKLVDSGRPEVKVILYGGQQENAFTVAHRATGEWRAWRALMENNGLADPFDLGGRTTVPSGDLFINQGNTNLTQQLDIGLKIVEVEPGIVGNLTLKTEGLTETDWQIWLHSDELGDGSPVTITDSSFVGNPETARIILLLPGALSVTIDLSKDAWLLLWFARCFELTSNFIVSRSSLNVPPIELGLGKG